MNQIKYAVTKLSILAHKLNVEASNIAFETGCPDDEISRHLEATETINNLTEAVMGYMDDDAGRIQKLEAERLKILREQHADLRNTNKMQERYKKRIKLLNNKLKRVSESQTKNNNYENQKN
jgi:inorganic pyrophosphatase